MEIKLSNTPPTSMDGICTDYTENPNHIFDMSWDNMIHYYLKVFENRTNEDKRYIRSYSIKELEEDIYGELSFNTRKGWVRGDFKEIYNNLDEGVFLNKINDLIMEYGNVIVTYSNTYCIKSDIPFNLLSFAKGISVDMKVLSFKEVDEYSRDI